MKPQIPQSWRDSEVVGPFFDRLQVAASIILMLDYDGTLAPFQVERLRTQFYNGVRERLEYLIGLKKCRLIFISGRKAHELRDLANLSRPVEIWGSHGREHLGVDGSYAYTPFTAFENDALDKAIQILKQAYDKDLLECKINSVAVHWRKTPELKEMLQNQMQQMYKDLVKDKDSASAIHLLPFDGGVELRVGTGNKGDAVRSILAHAPANTMSAFLGDDVTDEEAFSALRARPSDGRKLGVLVRAEPRPSLAHLWLSPPEELLSFLDKWIQALETHDG